VTPSKTADVVSPPPIAPRLARPRRAGGRIALVRAVAALLWAVALVVAIGGDSFTTSSGVPTAVAALLSAYPLIDLVASLVESAAGSDRSAAVLRIDAALSGVAVAGLAAAAFAGDAGATLAVFGAWAFVSGAIQLGVALSRRRGATRQWPMIVSGALSTVAGLAFAASASGDSAGLGGLAGYAAFGAVLYLVWVARAGRRG